MIQIYKKIYFSFLPADRLITSNISLLTEHFVFRAATSVEKHQSVSGQARLLKYYLTINVQQMGGRLYRISCQRKDVDALQERTLLKKAV